MMPQFLNILIPFLLAIVQTNAIDLGHAYRRRSCEIQWTPCELNATLPTLCGSLSVPLDYTDLNSNATLDLELIKTPAAKHPSRGSILFNFGGPGANGREDFAYYGPRLQAATGGYHDLVTFVPRGTGNTLRFSCYNSTQDRNDAALAFPVTAGNSSDTALGKIWASSTIQAETCYAAQNKTGGLVGTAFVARDMMRIVDALGEDGLLRYWGVSYGTILGATAAAMFPHRMDKVILDGVVNPHEYYHNYEIELFTDTDKVLAGFCSACIAAPENCVLARNHTASDLLETIYSFLNTLKYNPIPIVLPPGGFLVEYSLVKALIFRSLYDPTSWSGLAILLDALLTVNTSIIIETFIAYTSASPGLDDEALMGIRCSDKFSRASNIAGVLPDINSRHQLSKLGGDTADSMVMQCAQWQIAAKERYNGNFQVRTRNPILIIGNSFDPATPLISARNVSSGFEGSVVLQHNAYGHDSLVQASLCTAKAIMAYFLNSTLPQPGTVCNVDTPLFSGKHGWKEVLQQLGYNGSD